MGLDMYLSKRHYVKQWDHIKPEFQYQVTVTRGGQPTNIKPERISYVIEQVAYWRKANAIHAWFVDNLQDGVDNCQEAYCSADQLRELLTVVEHALADRDRAPEILPTQEGFFFGGTEYDDYYFSDLEETKRMLTEILAEPDADHDDYYYQASW